MKYLGAVLTGLLAGALAALVALEVMAVVVMGTGNLGALADSESGVVALRAVPVLGAVGGAVVAVRIARRGGRQESRDRRDAR